MIVTEVKIEKAGTAGTSYGSIKEEYYKIMINVFDKWWEWQPTDIKKRLHLQEAIKYYDELRGIIHAS